MRQILDDGEGDRIEALFGRSVATIADRSATVMAEPLPGGRRRTERHFQREVVVPVLERGLVEMTGEGGLEPPASITSRRVSIPGFRHEGEEPGPVDVVLGEPSRPRAIELKWCWEAETFANCAWDVVKLAAAQAAGSIHRGYLLVGGSAAAFDAGAAGSEPLVFGEWTTETASLLTHPSLEGWWRRWRADVKPRPRLVPSTIASRLVGSADAAFKGVGFRVSIGRVQASGMNRLELDEEGRIVGLRIEPLPG
jgi:hypothetical protein